MPKGVRAFIPPERQCLYHNGGAGTPSDPAVYWVCPLPYEDNPGRQKAVLAASNARVEDWARRCGFTDVWVFAGPHPTQTVFGLDGMAEKAVDDFGNKLRQSRYETADPHITVRAGTNPQTWQVSGHLYVMLNKFGIPMRKKPMTEADRKFVDSGDYRVDQTWAYHDGRTKKRLDAQWNALIKTGLDPEAYHPVKVGCKRVHDDGDYSSYYETHEHTCKKLLLSHRDPVTNMRTYVSKPPNGLFLSKEVVENLMNKDKIKQLTIDQQKLQQKLWRTTAELEDLQVLMRGPWFEYHPHDPTLSRQEIQQCIDELKKEKQQQFATKSQLQQEFRSFQRRQAQLQRQLRAQRPQQMQLQKQWQLETQRLLQIRV